MPSPGSTFIHIAYLPGQQHNPIQPNSPLKLSYKLLYINSHEALSYQSNKNDTSYPPARTPTEARRRLRSHPCHTEVVQHSSPTDKARTARQTAPRRRPLAAAAAHTHLVLTMPHLSNHTLLHEAVAISSRNQQPASRQASKLGSTACM